MIELKRKVLTVDEIMGIAVSMKEEDSFMGREVCKYSLLMEFLTDVELNKNKDGMIVLDTGLFDEWYLDGTIEELDKSVANIDMIEKEYESLVDIKTSISNMTKSMQNKIDGMSEKDIDVASIIKQLKDVIPYGNNK